MTQPATQPVEVWYRNPEYYIRECVEVGVTRMAWDRALIVYKKIDPGRFMGMYYGSRFHEYIIIDDMGSQHFHSSEPNPVAVYPTWVYGDDWALLEELCAKNVGDDEAVCNDKSLPDDFRPRLGQVHRVVVMGAPPASTGIGRKFYKSLNEVQQEYPDCMIHLNGSWSFNIMFGLDFKSVDLDPKPVAKGGKIYLPNGRELHESRAADHWEWVSLMGFKPSELEIPRNRCIFNIKSAEWAAQHFKQELKFKFKADPPKKIEVPNSDIPDAEFRPTAARHVFMRRVKPHEGDMFLCDMCTLQNSCRYFRTGAVCVVPDSEPKELARYFGSRDAQQIIDGLGTLLQTQTHRLSRALEKETEADNGKVDPEVTKIINTLFDRGEKLAKLLDPRLRNPSIKLTQNHLTIGGANAQQALSGVIAELEARGVKREDITPEMVASLLGGGPEQTAIEAHVIGES